MGATAAETANGTGTAPPAAPAGAGASARATADAAGAAADGQDWELNRRFVLRLAGLPFEAVEGLRDADAAAWASRVPAAEDALAALAADLDAPLTALVTAVEDPRERRAVLAVRREVFNARLPKDAGAVRAVAARLDPDGAAALTAWLARREELAALLAEGGPLVDAALARARARLRVLAREDRLRRGLVLASPTLDAQLDAFVAEFEAATGVTPEVAATGGTGASGVVRAAGGAGVFAATAATAAAEGGGTRRGRAPAYTPDKRARKKERSLLAYLYRTACKTSPFSTFTAVAPGEFRAGAGEVRTDGEWTGHPRLNVVVLARLAELIAADPARRADLPVTLSAGWELDEDRVRFVRRSVTAGDDSAAVSFDAAHDRLFFLRRRGMLERLLALFADGVALRHADLEAWLAAETGAPPHEAARYCAALLELGMLQTAGLATDVHSADPLRDFQAALRDLGRDWADATADRLEAAAGHVDAYAAADAAGRRALLAALRRELLDVQRSLGAADASLPQTLLYEDVSERPVAADAERWQALAAEPLRALTGILPAFDVALPQRLVLKGFFLARYGRGGRCDDLLRLVHDFHEDVFTQYLQFTALKSPWAEDGSHAPEENWLGMPEVAALDRARAEFTRRMRALWSAHSERDADAAELVLDEDTIDAVRAELAPLGSAFDPHSHFVQLADRRDDPLVVLNNSYGGLAFPFTRFTHCFDTTSASTAGSAALRSGLREVQPDGAVFAEVTAGAATTNLNLHGRLTDYEIVCPGETSTAPPDARLDLDDLYAEHDAERDRLVLRSRRLGREVVPLYLGYLVPMVLPEVPRTLLLFSPTSRSRPEAWRGVPEGPERGGVTSRPRVRYRSLVLHRRRWTAAPGALPVRTPGADDAAWYLAWQRWRREHGLPARVFATVRPADDGTGPAAAFGGGAKPQYVDFDSPLSLTALEGLLAGGPVRTVFEEMLPEQDELHVRSPRGRHVAEVALEIVPRPGGRPAPDPDSRARHGRQDTPA
ncbi:lantibiotic dehydratase [Actinacidiphila sp. DG2A-62]|uniref:lantibiotic dehydratase n=1 Tax=Actinacidiphila sp. DG2A-62 TaxID=3108821 RepID=UPI002DB7228E|nr:lantibiotic dehydratase [Actinacidiphila sp. DG2A-62]MEC3997826.1 lantibiotic dehydratase [Actinacidiphila sp. DG2A-62]